MDKDTEEKWRVVVVGENDIYNDYLVSTQGNVMSLKFGKKKMLKPVIDEQGYCVVYLYTNNKLNKFRTHRLAACAFIPNIMNYPEVEHINCIPSDNRIKNLRWNSHKGNMNNEITRKRMSEAKKKRKKECNNAL